MMRLVVAATTVLLGTGHQASAGYTCDIANGFAAEASRTIDQMADMQEQASAGGLTMEQVKQAVEEFADFQQEISERVTDMFRKGCKPGDRLTIPLPAAARDLCDFNKDVVQQGDATTCTMRQSSP